MHLQSAALDIQFDGMTLLVAPFIATDEIYTLELEPNLDFPELDFDLAGEFAEENRAEPVIPSQLNLLYAAGWNSNRTQQPHSMLIKIDEEGKTIAYLCGTLEMGQRMSSHVPKDGIC